MLAGVSFLMGTAVLSETRAGAPPGCVEVYFLLFLLILGCLFSSQREQKERDTLFGMCHSRPDSFVCASIPSQHDDVITPPTYASPDEL